MAGRRVTAIRFDSPTPDSAWPWYPLADATHTLRCDTLDGPAILRDSYGKVVSQWHDPRAALAAMPAIAADRDAAWAGFLSYDIGRLFERLPSYAVDDLHLPMFAFLLFPRLVFSERNRVTGPALQDVPTADSALDFEFSRQSTSARFCLRNAEERERSFAPETYLAAARRSIDYIAAGDVFQINLAQRFSVSTPLSPAAIYGRLIAAAVPHYGALLDFGDFALVSQSPELFFRVDKDRRIVNRPIKGTRPLWPGMEGELRTSVKDQAELAMIVDLQRSDLGRICEIGSVQVTEPRLIEAHTTVYHGVATVEGFLRPDVGFLDILRALFPCGSVTGCPKIRAMEIIDELEPVRRGPYCGAIGRIEHDGTMAFSVAIRTIVLKDGVARVSVGGGIVADSQPHAEYDETMVKAGALFAALGVSIQ